MLQNFNHNFIVKALSIAMVLCLALPLWAEQKVDIYELSLYENLSTPDIKGDKQSKLIQDYQYEQAVALIRQSYEVELLRDNEVLVVTVPAEKLFASNDTTLLPDATKVLQPFERLLKTPGFYKLLLVMHSDNTGSASYLVGLTRSRVNSVYNWFDANGSVDYVVPYALGGTEPVADNNSMTNRRKNRRLEIYVVPCDVMLRQAKAGSIDINK